MVYKVVAVGDKKAGCFNRPFFVHTNEVAIRSFGSEVNSGNQDSALTHHPEDFVLYELGSWDEGTGVLKALDMPHPLVSGVEVLRKSPKMSPEEFQRLAKEHNAPGLN